MMDYRLTGFVLLVALFSTTSASFGGKEHVHIKVHVPHIINELHHEKKVVLVHHQPHEDHHHHEHVVYEGHGHGHGGYDGFLKGGHPGGGAVIIEDAGHGGGHGHYGGGHGHYGGGGGITGYGLSGYGHSGGGFSSYSGHGPSHYASAYGVDHHDSHHYHHH